MRAAYPDIEGHATRDGVRLGYEVFGEGDPTVLLMPTWTIIHSRFWKMQVPYLSRRYRVITYDGPGNGASDRITDPLRYSSESYAADAVEVLDACGVERAVVIGLSLGARYGLQLAHHDPERVMGLVLIGPALELAPPLAERAMILENLFEPLPPHPQGWVKYNVAYWHAEYRDFVEFFFGQAFSELHSTKPWEDAVGWALETGPEVLEAEARSRDLTISAQELLTGITCPTLVIHGTADRIQPHQSGVEAARLSGGTLISIEGAGHMPNVRDPVQVNLAIRRFIERLPR